MSAVPESSIDGATYRLRHPVTYSAAAAFIAGVISFPLALVLLDHAGFYAFKVAATNSATWFGVLLVMA